MSLSDFLSVRRLARLVPFVIVGCQRLAEPSAPDPVVSTPPDQFRISGTFAPTCAKPGELIASGPMVTVTDAAGNPQPNVTVTFGIAFGNGSIEHTSRVTDAHGEARTGWWRLNDQPGENVVVAKVGGRTTHAFSVISTASGAAKIVATFALVRVGGKPLPLTYSGGGTSWTITGGHYYLAEDGTWDFAYELNGESPSPPATACWGARFFSDGTQLRFYLRPGSYPASPFYQQRNGLFSLASITRGVMTVQYEDWLDFEDEVYELRTGSVPVIPGQP